eukprot:scaffold1019_cov255-Pinguiococcus_pyrenoidosus.AAC.13
MPIRRGGQQLGRLRSHFDLRIADECPRHERLGARRFAEDADGALRAQEQRERRQRAGQRRRDDALRLNVDRHGLHVGACDGERGRRLALRRHGVLVGRLHGHVYQSLEHRVQREVRRQVR